MERSCLLFLFTLLISQSLYAVSDCNIYIHGYTPNGKNYFGDLERQVVWDANQEIEVSAPIVAAKILDQIETCPVKSRVVLRPHSYGAAQVHYILGKGLIFHEHFPEHNYSKIYKRVSSVYAYTGAFHGTPVMDLVCTNKLTKLIGDLFGRECVHTISTSNIDNVAYKVQSPGVPTHLIYSTDRSGYLGTLGTIIAKHLVSWWSFVFKKVRNQNDNTLPIYATRGCAEKKLMKYEDSNCEKIDENYFIDFYHEKNRHHTEFLKDKEFMQLKVTSER